MNSDQERVKLTKINSQGVGFSEGSLTDNIPSFLLKTYEILENSKFFDIISWTRSGQGFVVKKVKQFADQILPVYFRHNNYTSFVRQLNMYDFHKTRQQNQQNAFKNFMFKKGHKYLLKEIQRKDYKKNKQNNKQIYNMLQNKKIVEPGSAQNYLKSKPDTNPTFQNQCFRSNIIELKKVQNQLQEKSLKLMAIKDFSSSSQTLMKAVDILFQCGLANKKSFIQFQILKTDYQLMKRKKHFCNYKQKKELQQAQQDNVMMKPTILQRYEQSNSKTNKEPPTDVKSSVKLGSFSGFQKYEPTHTTLFHSFRNE